MEIEQVPCKRCKKPMPKLRLTKYGYNFCVECSSEKPKVALDVVHGEGDHTWNDIVVVDSDTAQEIARKEATLLRKKTPVEVIDYDPDEPVFYLAKKEILTKLFKDSEGLGKNELEEDLEDFLEIEDEIDEDLSDEVEDLEDETD